MKKLAIGIALVTAYIGLLNWFMPHYCKLLRSYTALNPHSCVDVVPRYIVQRMEFHGVSTVESDGKGWYRFNRNGKWCRL